MRLTAAQQRVLDKLTVDWQTAYNLRARMTTLNALERLGLAERRGHGALGAMFSPTTTIQYRLSDT